jgi:hypothetical protein
MECKEAYHSSQVQGLEEITPRDSTHGERWVYATRDVVMAAVFLGTLGGDLTCAVGRDAETGKPFICERFEGAFDLRYGGVRGSIYVLPGQRFTTGKTQWDEEVVCDGAVRPIREIQVDDAKTYLLQLAQENKLIIKRYPERMPEIPGDDEDLVYRAVIWHRRSGDEILNRLKKYHPHLLARVLRAIEENK